MVAALAAGSAFTGMSEALITSASRKTVPPTASGRTWRSGLRQIQATSSVAHTARPSTGTCSKMCGATMCNVRLAVSAETRHAAAMPTRIQSILRPAGESRIAGACLLCVHAAIGANTQNATTAPR
ncbi:MAG: hypothetical protein FD124_2857 [Alphaproteobacteria bacterium]|nr:MAG: hypothetical protein FD124_2857 [Alphaproteobacteria bacterium]